MVIANFKNDSHPIVYGASQWNYGEVLRIQGLNLPKSVEIHFSLEKTAGQAIPRIGTTKDGVTDVVIPDSLLENEGELQDYFVYVWIYLTDATSGRTEHSLSIKVKARSKPEIPGGDDNADPFREAIEEVNSAAERAETAEQKAAEHAEQTKADAIKTGEDRTAIAEMVESVSGISEQVQAVKEYKEQAQTAATNALLSEQKSEQAKEAALQAQAGAEQHALDTAGDKTEVERLATQVRQDKTSVEQTAQGFGNTVQQAEQSINTAKTQAVETVNATKTDAVKVVQTAAQEIIADRERIQTNKADIADLRQSKSGAIVESVSGEFVKIGDSSESYFENLRVFGKSEQGENPSLDNPQDITNIGASGSVSIKVRGKNLIQYPYLQSHKYDPMYNAKAGSIIKNGGLTIKVLEDRSLHITGTAEKAVYINVFQDNDLSKRADIALSKKMLKDPNDGLFFYTYNKNEVVNDILYPQIEFGEIATEYEPWKGEQTLTLQTPNGLPGIKVTSGGNYTDENGQQWICDEIDLKRGKYVRYNNEYVITGNESIFLSESDGEPDEFSISIPNAYNVLKNIMPRSICICTNFSFRDGGTLTPNTCAVGYELLYLRLEKGKYTVDTLKVKLRELNGSGNPVKALYPNRNKDGYLTPIETDITKEEIEAYKKLHTYYPNTTITNDADAQMDVDYVADTKNYTDGKIKEVVSAQVQSLANLLSLMPLSTQATMIANDTNNILENVEEMKHE